MGEAAWSLTYEPAVYEDGSLFFPERLGHEVLETKKKVMGTYIFANQYLNQPIPDDAQDFKKAWLRYYDDLPDNRFTFAFVDPAISLADGADYTATAVVSVDALGRWYLVYANRQRITATETAEWIFKINEKFKPIVLGVEDVAYQKALLHILSDEMNKRQTTIPLKGVKRSTITVEGSKRSENSKPLRIRSLVPRFEWGRLLINRGLHDFELEYRTFPRGSHDDILDALASIEEIVFYPNKERKSNKPPHPSDPNYEKWFIEQMERGRPVHGEEI